MKCRFCGKKLKRNASRCAACGRFQSYEALTENGDYETYEESFEDIPYTDYEAITDYDEDQTDPPPVAPKKPRAKLPMPLILGAAVVAVVAFLVTGLFSGDDPQPTNPGGGEIFAESQEEYPLFWPKLSDSLDADTFTQDMVSSRVKFSGDNEGLTGYMERIRLDRDHKDQLDAYIRILQDNHFELVRQENDAWFFRFQGSNAPVTLISKGTEYHCSFWIAEENQDALLVSCQWMSDFGVSPYTAPMSPQQTSDNRIPAETKPTEVRPAETEPVETKPAETKPAETKPVETKPVETRPSVQDDLTLPDPTRFFGCVMGENQKYEDNGWMVSCRFDLDTGREVVSEFLKVLDSGNYPLEFICAEKKDYIRTSAELFTYYYFDYTGNNSQVKGLERKHNQTKQMIHYDVRLAVYYNYRGGWILVSFYYDDAFSLKDYGDRASRLPVDYTKAPQETLDSLDRGSGWNKNALTCTACDGDGDCHRCNGDGYLWSRASDKENRNCWACNNSGICQTCYGTGKR